MLPEIQERLKEDQVRQSICKEHFQAQQDGQTLTAADFKNLKNSLLNRKKRKTRSRREKNCFKRQKVMESEDEDASSVSRGEEFDLDSDDELDSSDDSESVFEDELGHDSDIQMDEQEDLTEATLEATLKHLDEIIEASKAQLLEPLMRQTEATGTCASLKKKIVKTELEKRLFCSNSTLLQRSCFNFRNTHAPQHRTI